MILNAFKAERKRNKLAAKVAARRRFEEHDRRKRIDQDKTLSDHRKFSDPPVFQAEGDSTQSSMGEALKNYTSLAGVQLASRPIASVGVRRDPNDDHPISDSVIAETTWDLERILQRPTYLGSWNWDATTTSGIVQRWLVPRDLLVTQLVATPFKLFRYWRGDLVIQFQVAGSPLVQGLMGVSFLPMVSSDFMMGLFKAPFSKVLSNLTANPTIYLYANANTAGELRIPFNHIQSYLDTGFTDSLYSNLGYVAMYVINQLKSGAATTPPVVISAYAYFENSQLKVPRYIPTVPSLKEPPVRSTHPLLRTATMDEFDFAAEGQLQAEGLSDILGVAKTAKGVAKSVTGVASTIAKALPSNVVTDTISSIASTVGGILDWLPFDRPAVAVSTEMVVVRGNGSMNTSVGPDFVEKFAIYPSAMNLLTPEHFGVSQDEMDMSYLLRKFTYVDTFALTTSDAIGKVLYTIPLSPMVAPLWLGQFVQATKNFPLLSYLGIPFQYWRGGITFKIQVVASSVHTAKLFAMFNYGVYLPLDNPVPVGGIASQYGFAFEITQGTNEFIFTVPYVALTPFLRVANGTIDETTSMGTLNVVVINALVAPTSVAPSINLNVFMAGGEDFEYSVLADQNSLIPAVDVILPWSQDTLFAAEGDSETSSSPSTNTTEIEQGVAPLNVSETTTNMSERDNLVAPPRHISDGVRAHFGTSIVSMMDLLKKYQLVEAISADQFQSGGYAIPISRYLGPTQMRTITGAGNITPAARLPSTGLMSWAASLFRQFRGPLRFKIVYIPMPGEAAPLRMFSATWLPRVQRPNDQGMAQLGYQMDSNGYNAVTSALLASCENRLASFTSICTGPNTIIEGEIPFMTRYNTLLTPYPTTEAQADQMLEIESLGWLYIHCHVPGTKEDLAGHFYVYLALGDESRFGCLYYGAMTYVNGCGVPSATTVVSPTVPFQPDTYTVQPSRLR